MSIVRSKSLFATVLISALWVCCSDSCAAPVTFQDMTAEIRTRVDARVRESSGPKDRLSPNGTEPSKSKGIDLTLPDWHEQFPGALPGQKPDSTSEKIFARLVRTVRETRKSNGHEYRLTLLDLAGETLATDKAGKIYVPLPLVQELTLAGKRGEASVAFALARMIGHITLGHGPPVGIRDRVFPDRSPSLMQYSPEEIVRADLFALRLTRTAGFDVDAALDGLRWQVASVDPKSVGLNRTARAAPYPGPSASGRLLRLLSEVDGAAASAEPFGLLRYDRIAGQFDRATDGSLARGKRAIIFVHGMGGSERTFEVMIPAVAQHERVKDASILVYRYPSQGSLSSAGAGLSREIKRVCAPEADLRFIAHSAGGLVVRWHADKLGGRMDHAITLGTPHAGSAMTDLKVLADLYRRLPQPLSKDRNGSPATIDEGNGQIVQDLEPGSLFLHELGGSESTAKKIVAVYGRRFGSSVSGPSGAPKGESDSVSPDGPKASGILGRIRLPEEVTDGDGCVSVKSASLPDAQKVIGTRLDHLALKSDPEMIALVIQLLSR
ncbi:MAG: hypothetical protein EXS09_20420 [Gemmataceae bacterium]|nr:hypothetical protein [Gemmataceae bacterium]